MPGTPDRLPPAVHVSQSLLTLFPPCLLSSVPVFFFEDPSYPFFSQADFLTEKAGRSCPGRCSPSCGSAWSVPDDCCTALQEKDRQITGITALTQLKDTEKTINQGLREEAWVLDAAGVEAALFLYCVWWDGRGRWEAWKQRWWPTRWDYRWGEECKSTRLLVSTVARLAIARACRPRWQRGTALMPRFGHLKGTGIGFSWGVPERELPFTGPSWPAPPGRRTPHARRPFVPRPEVCCPTCTITPSQPGGGGVRVE